MSYARAAATNAARAFTEIPGPMLYPIVGNLHQYVFGPFNKFKYHEALAQLHKEYGPLVKENIGGRVIVHVFDTEDIKTVTCCWKKFRLFDAEQFIFFFFAHDLGLFTRGKMAGYPSSPGNYPNVPRTEANVPWSGKHQRRRVVPTENKLAAENVETKGGTCTLGRHR
jgi:hypothetical protein